VLYFNLGGRSAWPPRNCQMLRPNALAIRANMARMGARDMGWLLPGRGALFMSAVRGLGRLCRFSAAGGHPNSPRAVAAGG
jgi:hypothetical protein